MTHTCPCCGAASPEPIKTEQAARELPPVQSAILRVLATEFGEFIPTAKIAKAVWAYDPQGGPDGYSVSICQAVKRMQPRLAEHGLAAEAMRFRGYRVRAA